VNTDPIPDLLAQVNPQLMSEHLLYLAQDPLPFRKANYTLPGHDRDTLAEADDFIAGQLEAWGYQVEREEVAVQAYRCDASKPKSSQYSPPAAEDRKSVV
jgi:hypothetical protein